jgi:hypothetical protein
MSTAVTRPVSNDRAYTIPIRTTPVATIVQRASAVTA